MVARQKEEERRVREETVTTSLLESVDLYDKLMEMTGWKVTDNHDKYPMIGQKMFTGSTSWTP